VWEEYQHAPVENGEHWKIRDFLEHELTTAGKRIAELEREKKDLKAKLTALHTRQFKTNKKWFFSRICD
jgi:uncharacterized protein involved in exopolysaccharide biosynthesis